MKRSRAQWRTLGVLAASTHLASCVGVEDSTSDAGALEEDFVAQGEESSEKLEARLAFLRRAAAEEPDPTKFKFIGYVRRPGLSGPLWLHDEPPTSDNVDELVEMALALEAEENGGWERIADDPEDDTARGVLASADGRVYLEREEIVAQRRLKRLTQPPKGRSDPGGNGSGNGGGEDGGADKGEDEGLAAWEGAETGGRESAQDFFAIDGPTRGSDNEEDLDIINRPSPTLGQTEDNIEGGDDRELIRWASDSYPHRAVGVAVLNAEDLDGPDPPLEENDYVGSGAMVGPRAVLTAGHVVWALYNHPEIVDGDNYHEAIVLPGGRGPTHSGSSNTIDENSGCEGYDCTDAPFGQRPVVWFYWPVEGNPEVNTCLDAGIRYDYGVLILDNIDWSPGRISFGYNDNVVQLDHAWYWSAGYPGPSKTCDASPETDGKCHGYQYREYGKVTAVYTNTAYHLFDTQEGQSGANIYEYDNGNRTTYFINTNAGSGLACGKRLRSGSFNTICDWIGNWPSSYFSNVSC